LEKKEEKEIKKGPEPEVIRKIRYVAPYITRNPVLGWLFDFLNNLWFGFFGK
jgi:hypothetical protein